MQLNFSQLFVFKWRLLPAIIAIGVVILLVLYLVFSAPVEGGDHLDVRRAQDMNEIIGALSLYASAHKGMYPDSLETLVVNGYLAHQYTDPETNASYRYVITHGSDRMVCTVFSDGADHCFLARRDVGASAE